MIKWAFCLVFACLLYSNLSEGAALAAILIVMALVFICEYLATITNVLCGIQDSLNEINNNRV